MTQPPIDLASLVRPDRVVVLPGNPSRALVITTLADLATTDLPAHDRVAFIQAALEREDVTTTAIGGGVAIPHARTLSLSSCRVAVGVLSDGVAWGASDGMPVHLALFIAACESDHAGHLKVMASLAVRLRRPGLVELVRGLTEQTAIIQAILA